MTSFVEHISTIDGAYVKTSKQKSLKDNSMVKGFVTIIKNEGRADEQILCKDKPNLLTDTGRDYAIAQFYTNTSAGGVGCNFIALTVNTAAASTDSELLTGEIETNGLERALATTIDHSPGPDIGCRGGIRLGQIHAGPRDHRPAAPKRRDDHL